MVELATDLSVNYGTILRYKKVLNLDDKGQEIKWTDETLDKLREDAKFLSISELSKKYKTSESQISSVASNYFISLIDSKVNSHKKHRKWSKDEEDMLKNMWGSKSIEYISKKLDRSFSSILNRLNKLGLGSFSDNNADGLSISYICEQLGITRTTLSVTWVNLGLKIKKRKLSKYKSIQYILYKDLMEFLENNQNLYTTKSLEYMAFGEEPEWLKEKRQKDISNYYDKKKRNLAKERLILQKKYYSEMKKSEKAKKLVNTPKKE